MNNKSNDLFKQIVNLICDFVNNSQENSLWGSLRYEKI